MKRLLMLTALVAATATTGCSGTKWRVSGKCQSGQGCQIEGSVEGVIKSSGQSLLDQIYNSGSAVDAASFSIDTSGSTMSVPGNGHVTINLVVASSGATVASATVPWHRVGSAIVLSNPDSVNAWALASGGMPTPSRTSFTRLPHLPPRQNCT